MKKMFKGIFSVLCAMILAFALTCCAHQEGVKSIRLDKTEVTLTVGESVVLTATLEPEAASETIAWTSTNDAVATVENGTVTAVSAGSAVIKATAGGKTAECAVTVQDPEVAVDHVELSANTLSLKTGETGQLTATVSPANATHKEVTWTSMNDAVATVENGTVTAVSAGSAVIKATAGGKTAECTVTVEWSSRYEELTAIASKEYAKATVTITTKGRYDTLTDVYEVTKLANGYKITFTKQRLALIETDGNGNLVLPAERVITEEGEREYDANWRETKRSGSNAEIPVKTLSLSGYTFDEAYFEDAQFSDNSFEAKVVDATAFVGTEFNYDDLFVKVQTEDGLSLELTYTGEAGTTSVLFHFE